MTTKTKQVDRNGNVSYRIERDGQFVGMVHKGCSGYQAEFLTGSWVPAASIAKAIALLER